MKYNVGDIILTISNEGMPKKFRNRVGVILEVSERINKEQPIYRIILSGMDKEIVGATTWMSEDSVQKILYKAHPLPP